MRGGAGLTVVGLREVSPLWIVIFLLIVVVVRILQSTRVIPPVDLSDTGWFSERAKGGVRREPSVFLDWKCSGWTVCLTSRD